tara:strand:+ start:833 stop:1078 length:246 start_codon:yes stop_codon:yes gene_type:complete
MDKLTEYPIILNAPSYIELTCELAGAWLESTYLDPLYQEDDDGGQSYTDEAQEVFIDWLSIVEDIMTNNKIFKEGDDLPIK